MLGKLEKRIGVPEDRLNEIKNHPISLPSRGRDSPKLKEATARMVGLAVWREGGDIRDVISIDKLILRNEGPAEIQAIILMVGRIMTRRE